MHEWYREFGGHELRVRAWEAHAPASGDAVGGATDATRGVLGRSGGPVAVLLHDGLGAIESWKQLPGALAAAGRRRIVAYDRWGHGGAAPRLRFDPGFMEAEVPVLTDILDALGVASADLVGHSDGATIALLTAARHAERVRSVVSIAAHTFVERETTSSISALLAALDRGEPPTWLRRLHGARGDDLLRAWAGVWLGQVHGAWDVRDELAAIRCPVLATQGERDAFGSDDQLVAMADRVENAQIWRVAGAGHSPHHDAAEVFVERVVRLWGSVTG